MQLKLLRTQVMQHEQVLGILRYGIEFVVIDKDIQLKLFRTQVMRHEQVLAWFKVAVSAADSAGTETDRSRRLRSVSGDTRKTLYRKLKKF